MEPREIANKIGAGRFAPARQREFPAGAGKAGFRR